MPSLPPELPGVLDAREHKRLILKIENLESQLRLVKMTNADLYSQLSEADDMRRRLKEWLEVPIGYID